MTAFSRLQLAAALLEYDNDPDDPSTSRSAQSSAIFSHIRTHNAPRARILTGFEHLREPQNLLGVDIPRSDAGSTRGSLDARRSLAGTRNSKGSIDLLRNPFGEDVPESERGDEESGGDDLEVDLEAWGMADFLGKEKERPKSKNQRSGPRTRQPSNTYSEKLPSPHTSMTINEFGQLNVPRHRTAGVRSKSMSGLGTGDEFFEALRAPVASEADFRRRSIGAPLDPTGRTTPNFERPLSVVGPARHLPNRRNLSHGQSSHNIPFPSSSPDPGDGNDVPDSFAVPLTSRTSRFDHKATHTRSMSNASLGSRMILEPVRERTSSAGDPDVGENPFALPPPSPTRTSRFDPKAAAQPRPMSGVSMGGRSMLDPRERTMSMATMGTQAYLDDNPLSLPPRASRFDPKATTHARTMSNASLGSRLPPEADKMSMASGQPLDPDPPQPRRYSRMELMRPKVLVMPSPLQAGEHVGVDPQLPAGFQLTTVGPPLPPGAKSAGRPVSRPMSSFGGLQVPVDSHSFTPNPRVSMSLSQLTFRNSLMIGGQRDVAFEDIETGLRRAREDGEQIHQEENIEDEIEEEQKQAQGRAPGKLYGRSLMDELEARKDKMRAKQRVFTGDQRPSMMSRGQIRRSSTLIDPATLQDRPASQTLGNRPPLTRSGSCGNKPLLDFSGEAPISPGTGNGRMQSSKSVFGVDQLWERELAKLKEIEAAEIAEEEARKRKEIEKAAKKGKGKGKGKIPFQPPSPSSSEAIPRPSKVSDLPPTLPIIEKATTRRPRPPVLPEFDSDGGSEASENEAKAKAAAMKGSEAGGWGSSDDENRRQRTRRAGSDSEDDVPLARTLRLPSIHAASSDSEDEKPLANILEKKSMMPDANFEGLFGGLNSSRTPAPADDEDNTPLAVRHPHAQSIVALSVARDDDDEKPLGLKQAEQQQQQQQQQQAQYNLMAQQQLMMQAQLRNSMAFGAPSMLSGFSPFIMGAPAFSPAPTVPMHDSVKYQSVDQWRHNVAAE